MATPAAAENASLPQAVELAILTNPEIGAQFQLFQSTLEDQAIERGALRPQVDVTGWTGRNWRSHSDGGYASNWNGSGYNLSLSQLLFDGFSTLNRVREAGFEKLAEYYSLKATIDSVAIEATRAYLDVQRFREQVRLANDNYETHRRTLGLLSERSESGVGRGVDVTQANARLALAQSNVMVATGNLNDVTQRYQRIVGKAPADNLSDTQNVGHEIPAAAQDFNDAIRNNPAILAKQALVQAAERGKASARGRFAPTIELVADTGRSQDQPPGYPDRNAQNSRIQVVANFNLYRGGADSARVRQTAARAYAAQDIRNYTCRNVEQELAIAWNEVMRLRQQIPFLEKHVLESSKVRVAYMQQFKIGERSLLDLLDSENELFDARQALNNGQHDLQIAEYRWLGMAHRLLPTIGLGDPYADSPKEAADLNFPDEMLQACLTPLPSPGSFEPVEVKYRSGTNPPILDKSGAQPAAGSWD